MWLINILGLALMAYIVWWFWLWKPAAPAGAGSELKTIIVESGVYSPARLVVPAGRATTLHFLRKDPSPCASTVVFAQWDISAELPLDREISVTIRPQEAGVFPFSCQMQMYRGEIHVVENEAGQPGADVPGE